MKAIVLDIRQGDIREEFVVEMETDGTRRSFRLRLVLPRLDTIEPLDPGFLNTFQYTLVPRKVGQLIYRTYQGEQFDFPLDLDSFQLSGR